jgi:hypothetical protein
MAEVLDGNNFVSKQQAIRQSNNTSGVVVDEVTQIDNRAMDGFSCRQQRVGVFPSLCHMGKNGILMQQTGNMFDSAETNTIVEYYGHLPSVVFCICMILPT